MTSGMATFVVAWMRCPLCSWAFDCLVYVYYHCLERVGRCGLAGGSASLGAALRLQSSRQLLISLCASCMWDVSLSSQLLLQPPAVCQSAPPSWTYPSGTIGQLSPSFYKMPLSWCFITAPVRLPERPPIRFSHVCFPVCAYFVCVQQRGWGTQMFCFCQWRQKLHRQCLRPRENLTVNFHDATKCYLTTAKCLR